MITIEYEMFKGDSDEMFNRRKFNECSMSVHFKVHNIIKLNK